MLTKNWARRAGQPLSGQEDLTRTYARSRICSNISFTSEKRSLAGMMLLQRLELTRSTGPYVVNAIYDTRVPPGIEWTVSFEKGK
jgi:hypothetical protein